MEGQDGAVPRGGLQQPDPSQLRISDDDRHKVAEMLREAAGEGRIDVEELDERLEATYRAKTYGQLVPITVDLPGKGRPHQVQPARSGARPVPSGARYSGSIAVMSETRRSGAWFVPDRHSAFALMGGVTLDLREAHFENDELTIFANAVMGEVRVIVNAATTVVVEGTGVMGEYTEQRPKVPFDPGPGGPVVHLKGLALMGSVNVRRKGPPGPSIREWLGHGH